nr:hypothetical protein [Tanacetum cinerariifolium]
KGAGVAAQAVPQHMHAPDQPQDHLSTPPRQQTSDPNAPAFEHGQSSDPNIASFSRTHKTDDGPFTNVEDAPLGGSFHMSPSRSTQASHAGQTSGGVEDLITITALTLKLGPPGIQATIDKTPYIITEDLVRSQLQLADDGGIDDLLIAEIYSGMDNLGYVTEGDNLTGLATFLRGWLVT